jgi:hypothetical protein
LSQSSGVNFVIQHDEVTPLRSQEGGGGFDHGNFMPPVKLKRDSKPRHYIPNR